MTVSTLEAPVAAATRRAPAGAFIKALGYLVFEVSDLGDWSRFASGVLGVQVEPFDGGLRLKIDERAYRFVLTQGPADDIVVAGWQVADAAALDAYAAHLSALNVAFEEGSAGDAAARSVERLLRVTDPNGLVHEVYVDGAAGAPFQPSLTKGGFVVGPAGLGHIVFGSKDYTGSIAFAEDVLGARVSDVVEQVINPQVTAHITFLHVNQRHHSIAFAGRAGAKKLHHFMIEVERVDDVGRARDRHLAAGLPVVQDIGQHPNDQMISYYGVTPSGFLMEYGWGGVKVDVDTWASGQVYDRISEWGHRPAATPAKPSPPPSPKETPMSVAGDWKLVINTPMGEQKSDLTLADDLSGKVTSMGMPADVYGGALDGDKLSFKADVTLPFPMTLSFSLSVSGDAVSGEVQAGAFGASPVRGERA